MIADAIAQNRDTVDRELGLKSAVQLVDLGDLSKLNATSIDAKWPDGIYPHMLILIKRVFPLQLLPLLAERCIMPATDVLDRTDITDDLIRSHGLLGPPFIEATNLTLPRMLLIVQTDATAAHIERSRPTAAEARRSPELLSRTAPLLAVVPHQHTNVGGWRVRKPVASLRPVRKIGILAGNRMNKPSENETLQLATAACDIAGASLVVINENKVGGRRATITTYTCDRRRTLVLPPRNTHGQNPSRSQLGKDCGKLKNAPTTCFSMSSQAFYHDVPWIDEIDVALLWPSQQNYRSNELEARPPTRMLFWWSHGVPTIFYPFAAYVEVARAAGYELPARSPRKAGKVRPRLAGWAAADMSPVVATATAALRLPVATSIVVFSQVLRRLVSDSGARRTLADVGLLAVQRYSPMAVGVQLLRAAHDAVASQPECTRRGAALGRKPN